MTGTTDILEPLPDTPATRRRVNTRMRLVRASLEAFVDKGIDGATIDDLVSAAGFTRGAFYSSFSRKEEVFYALFESVTDEVIEKVRTCVEEALAQVMAAGADDADDAAVMVAVFEAIRPYGRQWYLLYSEAVAHALRSEEALVQLNAQRRRLRDEIARALEHGMRVKDERCGIGVEHLAQLLIGVFVDLMVQENLDGDDVTTLAGTTIHGVMRAFVVPR
ncbi:TetR/AcrR family transcriptional regulator [Brachybacterium huguangmaarense]